jgi:HEAT repeat protein
MLGPIARARLQELGRSATPPVAIRALRALAEAGDGNARATLVRQARGGPESAEGLNALVAMAHLGDVPSMETVAGLAATGSAPQRAALLPVVGDVVPARLESVLAAALADRDLHLRLTALRVAGDRGVRAVVPKILPLLEERPFLVALAAAAALERLGNASGRRLMDEALSSDLADTRLAAGAALASGRDGRLVAALTPLLDDADVLVRLQAASLLVDRVARAADVLRAAAADANPAVRGEAAKVVAARPTPDLSLLASMLRDTSPWVRLEAAVRLARAV